MAWHITACGGVAHPDADLWDLRLEVLERGQGASQLEVRLPRPAGVVPVHIRGGASQVRIRQPAGVPVQLRVGSGVADLRFDEQEWGAVGGGCGWPPPRPPRSPTALRSRAPQGPRARAVPGGTEAELQGLTTNRKWES